MANHRLVCIGDSLTQGFKSGAIHEPEISYPTMIAWEMGLEDDDFRFPPFKGKGGLPINLEYLLRRLDVSFGKNINFLEFPFAGIMLREWMDETEDHWERGRGADPILYDGPYHNLAVWGFEIQDAYQITPELCDSVIGNGTENWFQQVPEAAMLRTARRVLNPNFSSDPKDRKATQVTRVAQLAKDGIENLIVFLGNNNVLGSMTSLNVRKSTTNDLKEVNPHKRKATVYTPAHFKMVLKTLMDEIEKIPGIQRVIWGTVPPVTVPPVTNGVGGRMTSDAGQISPYGDKDDPEWYRRYFQYYTRPWITEGNFNVKDDPFIKGQTAMEIDGIIMEYRKTLFGLVESHNTKKKKENWFVADLHQVLERVAARRYEDPSVPPPPNWTPYELPDSYENLGLNTRFLRAKDGDRIHGGLFSLDGIHPTTAGYGIVAHEIINVMQDAGVDFFWGDKQTKRNTPIQVDWKRILRLDSLVKSPPHTLDDLWDLLVDGDQIIDMFKMAFRALTFKG